jgi:carotenoid 1,2-hydratase
VITFVGAVFSPWYGWSGRGDPRDHCCVNVLMEGPGSGPPGLLGGGWTHTDRGRDALRQRPDRIDVGPSHATWDGTSFRVAIDERAWPLGLRVRGEVVVTPRAVTDVEVMLSPDGAHVWRPFAPASDIRVEIDRPGWSWEGEGYLDGNFGTRPLEEDFSFWHWGRFPTPEGTVIFYECERRASGGQPAGETRVALRFGDDGAVQAVPRPPLRPMKRTRWGLRQETRCDAGHEPLRLRSMISAPFYNRAVVETHIHGHRSVGTYEALDGRKFAWPWLKPMVALRVPRRRGWS